MLDLVVTLEPHKGVQQTDLGLVEVELDQYRVFAAANGRKLCVGYVGKRSGLPFCPTAPFVELPETVQDEIYRQVCQVIGEDRILGLKPLTREQLEAAGLADESEEDE